MSKLVWIKANWDDSWENRKQFVTAGLEAGADAVTVLPGEAEKIHELGNITTVAESDDKANIVLIEIGSPSELKNAISSSKSLREDDREVAIFVEIANKELEQAAVSSGKVADYLIAVGAGWKVIPLENLIAELQDEKVHILAGVKNAHEARTAVETLEVGASGVFLDPRTGGVDEIKRVCEEIERITTEKIELTPAKVLRIEPAGTGDRVCIDITSLMEAGEGMLVGSQSNGLFLVHSETLESEYVETRPFRVNAGAVHAYLQIPNGKTKYLSELESGNEVLVVNAEGEASAAVVGRVKIERRPMLLVEAEWKGQKIKTMVQNAETINLVKEDGAPIPVTELEPGDKLLVHAERIGRHFGVEVEESLIEK